MEAENTYEALIRSCEILFGTDLRISSEFLDYLQISGIKCAFRKRAMETHPDRHSGRNRLLQQQRLSEFQMVREAYDHLLGFLREKEAIQQIQPEFAVSAIRNSSESITQNRHRSHPIGRRIKPIILAEDRIKPAVYSSTRAFYSGPLPQRQLLFGHFIYYLGLANWRTISRVLTWQRAERPRLGELGLRFGIFDREAITTILHYKKSSRLFGETARALGILSEQQLRTLLLHQQQLHKKFGTILLEKNLLQEYELQELLRLFHHHNNTILADS